MKSFKNINQTSENGGINIVGDGNMLNFYRQPIKYELLSKLCIGFINSNLNSNEDMNITDLPMELLEKIEYNDLVLHKEMYEELGMYLSDIQDVVNKSLGDKSIRLIRIIKRLYLETVSNNPTATNDQILFIIENKLMEHTSLVNSKEYYNEDIKYAICQIVLYVFEKCQILKKPKK